MPVRSIAGLLRPRVRRWLGPALLLILLGACRGGPSEDPPIHPIRNMYQQPRYNPQARSDFFEDGRTMRPLPEGTVAREMEVDFRSRTGFEEEGRTWVLQVPQTIVERHGGMEAMLVRGQDRFGIYCAPCHGLSGHGDGAVAQRAQGVGAAALKPPTFHDDRMRHLPDGQIYATITNGVRNMPAYRHSIPLEDRWALVGYLRALQLSQVQEATAMRTPEASP